MSLDVTNQRYVTSRIDVISEKHERIDVTCLSHLLEVCRHLHSKTLGPFKGVIAAATAATAATATTTTAATAATATTTAATAAAATATPRSHVQSRL